MFLNRLLLVGLVSIGISWTVLYVLDRQARAQDKAFYDQKVAPSLKQLDAFDTTVLDEWLERQSQRYAYQAARWNLVFGGVALFFIWALASGVQIERYWRRRNSPERPADPNAGSVVQALRQDGGVLDASSPGALLQRATAPQRIVVQVREETVTFHGFRFVKAFAGNRRVAELTLPFAELLGGRLLVGSRRRGLRLRTTAGIVTITDRVQPFDPLVAVLLDAAEVNRTLPARYASALAREPRISTPWWGWVLVVLALAGVGALGVVLWRLPPG